MVGYANGVLSRRIQCQIIVLFENRGQYLPFGLDKHIKILQQDFSSAICLPKDERRKASHLFLCHAL